MAGISASQQFRAVAYLRWCLFRNGFRRKGGAGEIVARIIVFPVAALFVIGPMLGAGFTSYFSARRDDLQNLLPIFWVIFALQILVSINISPPGLSFDPESLIRFPVTFFRYLIVRLFLGLLSASTVIGTMSLLAAALGISLAVPSLAFIAFTAAGALAICNMLFVRMIFAWVDRWLSTRRAREFFTFFIVVVSLGIQYVNISLNGFGRHHRADQQAKIDSAKRFYHHVQPILSSLPPGQAASAIFNASRGALGLAALNLIGILFCATVFLAIFAWRMQREYRGENLSEVNHSPDAKPLDRASRTSHVPMATAVVSPAKRSGHSLSPEIAAALQKEWIYIRRNPAQFYGLLVPFAMVFIFAARANTFSRGTWIFPGVIAYALLITSALAYNALGLDAAGIQFYFMAPVKMRTIFLAKNLFGFLINLLQIVLIYLLLCFTSGPPQSLIVITTICWAIFAALTNITVANMRSITTPKKLDPSRMSRKQGSQLSNLISTGIMLAAAGVGAGLIALGYFTNMPWLPIPILLVLDCGALALYLTGLGRIDSLVQTNRETLLEELTKASV